MGILHSLRKQNPNKEFYLLSSSLICTNMKKTRLKDIYTALRDEIYEIKIDKNIMKAARNSLEMMLKIS